jgi:hypothetical protein
MVKITFSVVCRACGCRLEFATNNFSKESLRPNVKIVNRISGRDIGPRLEDYTGWWWGGKTTRSKNGTKAQTAREGKIYRPTWHDLVMRITILNETVVY